MRKTLLFSLFFALLLPLTAASTAPSLCVVDFIIPDSSGLKGRELKLTLPDAPQPVTIPPVEVPSPEATEEEKLALLLNTYQQIIVMAHNASADDSNRELAQLKLFESQLQENQSKKLRDQAVAEGMRQSQLRPVLIGAQHFEALLASTVPHIRLVPRQVLYASMSKQLQAEDYPTDFLKRVSAESGVTHIVTGVVADLRSSSRKFTGYGITTESTIYELDVMVKAISLQDGTVLAGGVYTGKASLRIQPGQEVTDNNIYQTAFNAALNAAAKDFAAKIPALRPEASASLKEKK